MDNNFKYKIGTKVIIKNRNGKIYNGTICNFGLSQYNQY